MNFFHKKGWGAENNTDHVDPPTITLVKETSTGKPYWDYVKLNLRRYPTSSTLDPYEFRMSLFDYGKPEEFLLLVQNFQMNRASTGMLETEAKIQYLCTLVHGDALRQFDLLSADVKNTETPLDVNYIIKGLVWYSPPVN